VRAVLAAVRSRRVDHSYRVPCTPCSDFFPFQCAYKRFLGEVEPQRSARATNAGSSALFVRISSTDTTDWLARESCARESCASSLHISCCLEGRRKQRIRQLDLRPMRLPTPASGRHEQELREVDLARVDLSGIVRCGPGLWASPTVFQSLSRTRELRRRPPHTPLCAGVRVALRVLNWKMHCSSSRVAQTLVVWVYHLICMATVPRRPVRSPFSWEGGTSSALNV
jgi:hypothetical protein